MHSTYIFHYALPKCLWTLTLKRIHRLLWWSIWSWKCALFYWIYVPKYWYQIENNTCKLAGTRWLSFFQVNIIGKSPLETAHVTWALPPSCTFFGNKNGSITGGPKNNNSFDSISECERFKMHVISFVCTVNSEFNISSGLFVCAISHNACINAGILIWINLMYFQSAATLNGWKFVFCTCNYGKINKKTTNLFCALQRHTC